MLFRYTDRKGGSFWATPGGGVEEGETFEEAAIREAAEELGTKITIIKFLRERIVEISYSDRDVLQLERYFQVRIESWTPSQNMAEEYEREGILETRWWTKSELLATKEVVFPEDLAAWLD